jgi:hypothetical protein
MRKLITIIMILALLMPAAALADIDLSGMTREELIELDHRIQLQLFSEQLVNGVTINPGKYIVGEDLPAGTYRAEVIIPETSVAFGLACVYNPDDLWTETSGSMIGKGYENIGKLIMEDDQIFVVDLYSIIIYPYTGLFH